MNMDDSTIISLRAFKDRGHLWYSDNLGKHRLYRYLFIIAYEVVEC